MSFLRHPQKSQKNNSSYDDKLAWILAELVAETIQQFKGMGEYTVEELSEQSSMNTIRALNKINKLQKEQEKK